MPLPELFLNSSTPGQIVPLTTLGAAQSSTSSLTFTMNAAAPAGLRNTQQGQFVAIIDSEIVLFDATQCSTTTWTALQRGYDNSTQATHNNGTQVFHDLTKGSHDNYHQPWQSDAGLLQNGVLVAGALALSAISISTSTGALTFTVAASDGGVIAATPATQPCWVKNASGLLVPVYVPVQTVTLSLPALPATGNYMVMGVDISTTGVVSLSNGGNSAGTVPSAVQLEAGAPSLVAGKLRIADISVHNTAGVYHFGDDTTVAAQGVNWVDRRPHARGARVHAIASTSGPTTASATDVALAEMILRVESSGAPLRIMFNGAFSHSVIDDWVQVTLFEDNVAIAGTVRKGASNTAGAGFNVTSEISRVPSVGSHVYEARWQTNAATATATGLGRQLDLEEQVGTDWNNGLA